MNAKEAIEKVKEKFVEFKEQEESDNLYEENWDREEEELCSS